MSNEIMLFGVRVVVDSMRKSVSLNNLSQYEHRLDCSPPPSNGNKEVDAEMENEVVKDKDLAIAAGYASADDVTAAVTAAATTTASRERKRGIPWTEEEHKLFLLGLKQVGKGDWRGISRNFVKSRTPTQVASHAQKYFLRRSNLNRRRRRSSLFDITTDTVANPSNDHQVIVNETNSSSSNNNNSQANSEISNVRFSPETQIYPMTTFNNYSHDHTEMMNKLVKPVPVAPSSSKSSSMAGFDLNENSSMIDPLSLNLSLSMTTDLSNSRHSAFQVMQGFSNGESIISVA